MRIPETLFDLTNIDSLNIQGKGGRERVVSKLLPSWRRVNATLYDFETDYNGDKILLEIKKQHNIQWFDIGKYYNLEYSDRKIIMMFILHTNGSINRI